MSKASERRNKRRIKYLLQLVETDSEKFSREWSKRLESWSNQTRRNAGTLYPDDNNAEKSVFDIVDKAEEILKQCGQKAYELEAEATREILETECTKAVAQAVDHRLSRLTTTAMVCNQQLKPLGKK